MLACAPAVPAISAPAWPRRADTAASAATMPARADCASARAWSSLARVVQPFWASCSNRAASAAARAALARAATRLALASPMIPD
jgi:hypothetical protein